MRFLATIEQYVDDMRSEGRLTSAASERAYRDTLELHAEDLRNQDPRNANRNDVKSTLRRWSHPNTVRNRLSVLVSFYDWCMEEGIRKDNPARQVKRPRKRDTKVYRLTVDEARDVLLAADTARERRVAFLGICAGLRNQELRGVQGRHFDRPGYVWVSEDIGKGGRERWVPVIEDLECVVAEIQERCAPDEFVVPKQRVWNLDPERPAEDVPNQPSSGQTVWRIVERLGRRAGIAAHIHPHLLRHAYLDHVARYAGIRKAQFLAGHKDISTTQGYLDKPTLDELSQAVDGLSFLEPHTNTGSGGSVIPLESQKYRHGDSNPGSHPASLTERRKIQAQRTHEASQNSVHSEAEDG